MIVNTFICEYVLKYTVRNRIQNFIYAYRHRSTHIHTYMNVSCISNALWVLMWIMSKTLLQNQNYYLDANTLMLLKRNNRKHKYTHTHMYGRITRITNKTWGSLKEARKTNFAQWN